MLRLLSKLIDLDQGRRSIGELVPVLALEEARQRRGGVPGELLLAREGLRSVL